MMSQLNKFNLIKFLNVRQNTLILSRNCTKTATEAKTETPEPENETPIVLVQDDEDDIERKERERIRIQKLRNKSRLLPQHRNMLMEQVPYPDGPESWIHTTLKYKRGQFGKYGLASGIDPRICFPTATEQADKDEYERVAYPYTIKEMQKMNAEIRAAKQEKIQKREEDVAKKIGKLDQWMAEMNARIAKKEAEAKAARERKERLVEEVRRHFGYEVDIRDEKFKEVLAQKEKEDKKAQKEARKKQKEMKMLEKLIIKGKEATEDASTKGTEETPKSS